MKLQPILIPTDKNKLALFKDGKLSWTPGRGHYYETDSLDIIAQHIILIDPEAEIVEGDLIYDTDCDCIDIIKVISDKTKDDVKIVTSTNKEHNLSLLSDKSIKLLIDYYNSNEKMSEWVEIETWWELEPGNNPGDRKYDVEYIKLNPQGTVDIIIPEVKEKLYTKEEMMKKIADFGKDISYKHSMQNNIDLKSSLEFTINWLSKNL